MLKNFVDYFGAGENFHQGGRSKKSLFFWGGDAWSPPGVRGNSSSESEGAWEAHQGGSIGARPLQSSSWGGQIKFCRKNEPFPQNLLNFFENSTFGALMLYLVSSVQK